MSGSSPLNNGNICKSTCYLRLSHMSGIEVVTWETARNAE